MKVFIQKTLRKFGLEVKQTVKDIFSYDLYHKYYSEDSIKNKRFYNIGAGSFYHPYWTNVDYINEWYKDNNKLTKQGIHHNLFSLKKIPIDNSIAEIVYSSHTIEHIQNKHAQFLFDEAFRILKVGKGIRLTCPDIDLHYEAFKKRDYDFFFWIPWYSKEKDYKRAMLNQPLNKASIEQLFLHRFATSASTLHSDGVKKRITDDELNRVFREMRYEDALDYCCDRCTIEIQNKYPGNHINWWNREKVIGMLKKSGFKKISISGYGQSISPVLRNTSLFDSTHPKISLYIEATK